MPSHSGPHLLQCHPLSGPQRRRTKFEMGVLRGNSRRDLGCRAHQGHEETDLNCLARRALGGIERQTRGVPGAANDATVGPAVPHGPMCKQRTNLRRRNRKQTKTVTGCAARSLLSVSARYWSHLDLPIVTGLMYTTSSLLARGQRWKRSQA